MKELLGKSVSDIHELLSAKKIKAVEVAKVFLEHAKANDSKTSAFICHTDELALSQAEAIDNKIANGETLLPLAAIPLALKDNLCVQGYPTTCASKFLENFKPEYDATVVKKLFAAGTLCVGKVNMDEFAMGSSNENSAMKPAKNPWDLSCVPGGSSGGSAIACASGYSMISLGSDTGGSIRLPASFCGVVGMKPSYGVVSRFGLIAFASSLDQIGPMARRVEDVALALSQMQGKDPQDSTSIDASKISGYPVLSVDSVQTLKKESPKEILKGRKIGLIADTIGEGADSCVREATLDAVKRLEAEGATVEEVSLEYNKHVLPVYYLISSSEASANLARFDGVKYGARAKDAKDLNSLYSISRQEGFGPEVKRRIMLGTYALSSGYYDAYYKKAQQVRRLLLEEYDKLFFEQKFDALLMPTCPNTAFKLGEKTEDPLKMYLSDICTIPANLAGLPAISVPFGLDKKNLPIGLQLMAPRLCDDKLLRLAFALEKLAQSKSTVSPLLAASV
ncbi:MAG: Asp-tRNA(Asn)/Glu-tRNA(Gln) amidotransferase subunit GatA [Cyanobacteria bacterium TGS_CYA1]|nr:Asp-tRNA(Asn)/Glu-tRNA(Gln) amidotransferase subunit GatA [Cyanobacteria bacterium TGS_CYA1]